MDIERIDHFTISVPEHELTALRDFYRDALGMREGARPKFPFPGYWMYAPGIQQPLVHLAGNLGPDTARGALDTGKFNHLSFRTRGLGKARAELKACGVDFTEAPVPGFPLHQLFFDDPAGIRIELTFDAAELAAA